MRIFQNGEKKLSLGQNESMEKFKSHDCPVISSISLVKVQEALGAKARAPIYIEYHDLAIKDQDINPEGEYGSYGQADYDNRLIKIDKVRIEKSPYTEEEVKEHELIHILERDAVEAYLAHDHIVHAAYFGHKEQQRLLDMVYSAKDKRVQERLFGKTLDIETELDADKLANSIRTIEAALIKSKDKQITPGNVGKRRDDILRALVTINLNDLKAVYFSLLFKNPAIAIKFERGMKELKPECEFHGFRVYDFGAEAGLAQKVFHEEELRAGTMGRNAFPDNPRGVELRKKQALRLITGEEEAELINLFKDKHRKTGFSPEVRELWERTKAGDPNVKCVMMNDGQSIEVSAEDEDEKIIWTFGLGGCDAVAVLTETEDGTRNCVLTHYSVANLSKNSKKLSELLLGERKTKGGKSSSTALIFLNGEYEQDAKSGKWVLGAKYQKSIEMLTLALQVDLGEKVEIKVNFYSPVLNDEIDGGVLYVRVPPKGKGEVCYKTWRGGGRLEKS